ncbi:MAG: hypothetical protein JOZ70_12285 [Pseudolabrys sp.]|nr:hypothetical protein [Pseudolabrys sp.]MBV9956015.1 hypothetical protein [Pseudolabrys sp.]
MPERSDKEYRKQSLLQAIREERALAEEKAAAKAYAERIVKLFNARAAKNSNLDAASGRGHAFFPTIKCCVLAEMPVAATQCPGCRMITHTDLRAKDYHPLATIAALIFEVSCSRCSPNPPLATIRGLIVASPDYNQLRKTWGKWAVPKSQK